MKVIPFASRVSRLMTLMSLMSLSSFAALPVLKLNAPMALPPFTFAGRLTDAAHVAYGAEEIAEVRAYSTDGTTLLAKSSTIETSGTFYNFALDVPVATTASEGYVRPGTKVKLVFVDNDGNRYDSVVPEDKAVVGNPGECLCLTAFLGTDANGDGIADEYAELYLLYGQYLGYDIASFEADADYDGDGQSNLAEYVAGTDPFLAEDVFDTHALDIDFCPEDEAGARQADWTSVSFMTAPGRCYSVYSTQSLDDGSVWRLGSFSSAPKAEAEVRQFHTTGSTESGRASVFLPKDVARRFWRILVE